MMISDIDKASTLLSAFASSLSSKDRRYFSKLEKFQPYKYVEIAPHWSGKEIVGLGLSGIGSDKKECINNYCLQILPEVDDLIDEFHTPYYMKKEKEDGKYPIGCVWCKFFFGKEYFLLEAQAATTDMSRLFSDSEAIHDYWVNISKVANAKGCFLDKKDEYYWWLLYPNQNKYFKPDIDLFWIDNVIIVDAYVYETLRLAGGKLG